MQIYIILNLITKYCKYQIAKIKTIVKIKNLGLTEVFLFYGYVNKITYDAIDKSTFLRNSKKRVIK